MNTDLLAIEQDTEMLKKRRPWYLLALALFLFSLLLRQPLIFLASLLTLTIGLVPDLWYRYGLRHLGVRQYVSQQRLFFGEEVTLSITIENRKLLPLPWLEVEDTIAPPLTVLRKRARLRLENQDTLQSTWLIWSLQRVTRRYLMRCQTRGFHLFGPIRLHSSDPFGWLESEVQVPAYATLLVYPLLIPIEELNLSAVLPAGERSTQRRLLEDPLLVAGTRDYVIGDDPRRIHWKASAHAGTLQSKLYEPSSLRRLLVLLDVWNHTGSAQGTDLDLQEFTISVAASLLTWGLEVGYTVGLLTNCAIMSSPYEQAVRPASVVTQVKGADAPTELSSPIVHVPFSSDPGQYEQVLSTLARLAPAYSASIDHVIDTEESMFPLGTTIIFVSATRSVSETTLERLSDFYARGNAVQLVLTGKPTEQAPHEAYGLPVHYAGGKEVWRELTKTVGTAANSGTSTTSLQLD
jgi:uncharacterized protein (DUF58 family)